jgi:hypothetical protein
MLHQEQHVMNLVLILGFNIASALQPQGSTKPALKRLRSN